MKGILRRRLNFMVSFDKKSRICNVPKGIHVHILRIDGNQALILWKQWTKWVNEKWIKKI